MAPNDPLTELQLYDPFTINEYKLLDDLQLLYPRWSVHRLSSYYLCEHIIYLKNDDHNTLMIIDDSSFIKRFSKNIIDDHNL